MSFERLAGAAYALTCALAACSSGEPGATDFPMPDGSFFVREAGQDARVEGGIDGAADASDASMEQGPIVTIMSPAASTDPLAGPVLTGASYEVECEVQPRAGGQEIDPATVFVAAYAAGSATPVQPMQKAVPKVGNVYSARVTLDKLPTGRVRFECGASEAGSNNPKRTVRAVETFYDGGPVITFVSLDEDSVVALGSTTEPDMSIDFKVEPALLALGDAAAEPRDVTLFINNVPQTLPAKVDGVYKLPLDFNTFFANMPVASFTVAISAKNGRGASVSKSLTIDVDGSGPTVNIVAPEGQPPIVGGTVEVRFTVTDELSGVATASDRLTGSIKYNDEIISYPVQHDPVTNQYRFSFETSRFTETSNITASVSAYDNVGNETIATRSMRLDTVPPWIDLVPANVVEVTAEPRFCSASFPPLGNSPRDGQVIGRLERFRALVWERGLAGGREVFLAGVRDETVTFYSQSNRDQPLIVDEDKNGTCDAIKSSQAQGTKKPFETRFSPVAPGGTTPTPGEAASGNGWSCIGAPTATMPLRCESEMPFIISHTAEGRAPVVYASDPRSGVGCTGVSFDIQGNPGWTCIAVAARDKTGAIGNLGVSKPIKICRWLKAGDCGLSEFDPNGAPVILEPPADLTCTDGCTMPSAWTTFSSTSTRLPTYLLR
jgi:hypothetical protein